jgi:predicted Zn finger-like uncharacterized protein
MKIVCDSCGTRYAIDDARLPQGAFKIRCRRCAHVVVVDQREPADHWHLVLDGLEVGPLTATEVREQLAVGELDGDTYLWREGFSGWKPLWQVAEFAGLAQTMAAPVERGLFDDAPGPDPGEHEPAGPIPLTASRNECSVLFSIANLRELARQGDAPGPDGKSGSGLIDIRALAPREELHGGFTVGYVAPAAPAAVLVPAERSRPRWVLALVGIMAVTLAVILVTLVLVLRQRPVMATPAPRAPELVPASPSPPPPATAAPRAMTVTPPATPAAAPTPVTRREPTRPGKAKRPRRPRRVAARHEPGPAPTATAPARKVDELERLINKAAGVQPAAAPRERPERAATSTLPRSLEGHQIQAGLRRVREQVRACFDRFRVPGRADLRITISPAGRASAVSLAGIFAGTPTGACLRAAFFAARFPRFAGPALSVSYPVILR